MNWLGRWIAPGVRRSTSNSLSTEGLPATQMIIGCLLRLRQGRLRRRPPRGPGGEAAAGRSELECPPRVPAVHQRGQEAGVERVAGSDRVHRLDIAQRADLDELRLALRGKRALRAELDGDKRPPCGERVGRL